jgi:CDP-4-dehydro-6-deoxyglucose reductase, E1
MTAESLKAEILRLSRAYSTLVHSANRPGNDPARAPFTPGQTIPYAGRVFDEEEVTAAISSTLDFWLTLGPEGAAMEDELATFLGVKHCLLVNSGSSANLIAFSALTTHKLPDHKRIRPGDEVITVAAGFPTTVAPIIQCGAVPVFIDAKVQTGNANCELLEAAYHKGKTKAVMMAHALGNPFELSTVVEFCHRHDLWLIEDNCDALGCTYSIPVEKAKEIGLDHLIKIAEKGTHPIIRIHTDESNSGAGGRALPMLTAPTGSFGDISTQSFYPPHHLTMGEGGSVNIIRRAPLKTYAESFRDWGRDCWCPSGKDDTCSKRFQWQLGELPQGYDHKYIYSHLGYNVKPLDIQAAIGRVQMKRLPSFIDARKRNWEQLRRRLHGLEYILEFALPTHAISWIPPLGSPIDDPLISQFEWDDSGCRTDCSWFGFKITVKESAPFTRTELAQELDRNKIGNRMLFGGNLVRQPAFVQLRRDRPNAMRTATDLPEADRIMNHTLFLGTYPGLTKDQIDFMAKIIRDFVTSKR